MVASDLLAVRFDAIDPRSLAGFWAGLLGWDTSPADDLQLVPRDDTSYRIRFAPTDAPKTLQNRIHLDLTSGSLDEQEQTVARALELGARHLDIGQSPDEAHVVLGDPEGNEFCVIEPGNEFLAGCGLIGAINCDGTREVGHFWSKVLGWPLVWDQDEETAIQSPRGGTKITWSGPPLMPQDGKNRLQLDLRAIGGLSAEVDRLLSLGATRLTGGEESGEVVLLDPDGNEFCLFADR